MARFADRTKRLGRRREQQVFSDIIMPVAWVAGFAGLLGMGVLGAAYLMKAVWLSEAFAVFGVAACVPVLMVVLRAARGHFSRELTEP